MSDYTRLSNSKGTEKTKRHRKSRFGCPQCRERKIKCDEVLPVCSRCSLKSIRCGYLDFTKEDIDLIKLSHSGNGGFDPITNPLPHQQYNSELKPALIQHNAHSIQDTDKFYGHSSWNHLPMIGSYHSLRPKYSNSSYHHHQSNVLLLPKVAKIEGHRYHTETISSSTPNHTSLPITPIVSPEPDENGFINPVHYFINQSSSFLPNAG